MSVLQRFVRIREYRNCAAKFRGIAEACVGENVKGRYLAVADHYTALADLEMRSDKIVRAERLEQLRLTREQAKTSARQTSTVVP
jgi:hypothetical protein